MIDQQFTGEELDWLDAKRAEIVRRARAEVGPQSKGSPEVVGYWREVLPKSWSDERVKLFAASADWCGGFVLWCYRMADVAQDVTWTMGEGFAKPAWMTSTPKPGDLCIRPLNSAGKPVWHHAIVESHDGATLVTIDGNQPGVLVRRRPVPRGNMVYYSIDSLLVRALRAPAPGAGHV